MTQELSVVVYPWPRWREDVELGHRYMAFGLVIDGKFSGMVHDYQGGGTYGDQLFLDGKPMPDEDRDEDLAVLDERFPGLMDRIEKAREEIATYTGNDGRWAPTAQFAKDYMAAAQGDERFVWETGPEVPEVPEIGNTFFTKAKAKGVRP